jgi:DNA-binding HxlR family transcriptional regulator
MSQRNTCVSDQVNGIQVCEIRDVLNRVSGKWSLRILIAAVQRTVRYTELERSIPGISRRMLTLTLRNLERDGLLVRKVYPTVPPKVEYSATDVARDLCGSLVELTVWAQRCRAASVEARDRYARIGREEQVRSS